jgi:hypothetical protein
VSHDLVSRRWRTGRKVYRTIYAVMGAEPSDYDILIGLMDAAGLAAEAVRAHNRALDDESQIPGQAALALPDA